MDLTVEVEEEQKEEWEVVTEIIFHWPISHQPEHLFQEVPLEHTTGLVVEEENVEQEEQEQEQEADVIR